MNTALLVFGAAAVALTVLAVVWALQPMTGPRGSAARRPRGRAAWLASLCVPLLAVSIYAKLGAPRAMTMQAQAPAHREGPADMAQAADALQQRLRAQPDDAEGWFLLARTRQALGEWDASAQAYREALARLPGDASLSADLADVLASAAGGDLEGEPRALVEQALQVDPRHVKARALLAMAEFRLGRLDSASHHWRELSKIVPEGHEAAAMARDGLARVARLRQAATPRQ